MDNTLTIALATAASAIAGKLLNMWERKRQNDRDDLKELRADARTGHVLDKLKENTELTAEVRIEATNAFNAANDVNTKFLKIHARLDSVEGRLDALLKH